LIPDSAVHDTADQDRLVAAVEVGDLSSPTKLSALEAALPGVRIWWVPKADLLHLVVPEIGRYRLAWAEGGPEANDLLRQVVSARVTTERLAQEVAKQALAARDGLRGVVRALRQQSDTSLQLVREQAKTIERTIRALGRWEEQQLAATDVVDATADDVLEHLEWEAVTVLGADVFRRLVLEALSEVEPRVAASLRRKLRDRWAAESGRADIITESDRRSDA
jgi:hypothetical protein